MSSAHRGQVFSSDLVLAFVIFTIIFAIFLTTWQYNKNRMIEAEYVRGIEAVGYGFADVLVRTPGEPADWEKNLSAQEGILSLGLVKFDRNIDEGKLNALSGLSQAVLRNVSRSAEKGVQVVLRDRGGAVIKATAEAPKTEHAITVTRLAIYRGEPAFLDVKVWGNRTVAGVIL